jgi:5-methylthioadenosine/S-adenosylhomocysteine deaminase
VESIDILVKNGWVLTMDPQDTLIERGAVAVSADRIVDVDTEDALTASYQAAQTIDARGGIIMPGLVNAHTHAAMTCFRGLADDLPLMTWLNDYIFPAEAKLTPDIVYQGTRLACSEMILSGTTTFCDMYLFEEAVARAAKEVGIRAVVGEVIYDFPSPNYGPVEEGLKYTEDLIQKWRDDSLITIAVEPHSAYVCSPELLQKAMAIAERNGVPMVIHLAETEREVAEIREKYGRTPVTHLADIGFLSSSLIADHCVVLSEKDMTLMTDYDVKVAHNPESNMKLASGIAPIPELLKRGVTVGIGTDGCASNNNLDMFQEMDSAAKLHKVHALDPTVMDARTVVRMATIDGARVLARPHLIPMYNVYSHLVYAVTGSDVVTAIVNGRVLMEQRVFTALDVDEVMAAVNRISQDMRPR